MEFPAMNSFYLVSLGFSFLISTGAIAFVFKYGIRLAVVESKLEDAEKLKSQQQTMDNRLVLVEEAVKKFEKAAESLTRLPAIEEMVSRAVDMLEKQVPREELDNRLSDFNRRIESLESSR